MSVKAGLPIVKLRIGLSIILLLTGGLTGCLSVENRAIADEPEATVQLPPTITYATTFPPSDEGMDFSGSVPKLTPGDISTPTNSTNPVPVFKFEAGWKLAFVMIEKDKNGVYVYSGDTGEIRNITETFSDQVSFSSPSWSPDGRQIAYHWGTVGVYDTYIRIANIDGSADQELTNGHSPTWSPDGKEIVFIREGDIYKIDLETRKVSPLLVTEDFLEAAPAWSPDGKWIAFIHYQQLDNGNLVVMDSDGSRLKRIETGMYFSGKGEIDWSTDGEKITLTAGNRCGNIYEVDLKSNLVRRLVDTLADEGGPSWSPDGNWIIYAGTPPNQSCFSEEGQRVSLAVRIYAKRKDLSSGQMILEFNSSAWMTSPAWSPVVFLETGKNYVISPLGNRLRLRESPSTQARIIKQFNTGEIITPLEGPLIEGEYRWWKVEEETGLMGWVVEEPGWFRLVP